MAKAKAQKTEKPKPRAKTPKKATAPETADPKLNNLGEPIHRKTLVEVEEPRDGCFRVRIEGDCKEVHVMMKDLASALGHLVGTYSNGILGMAKITDLIVRTISSVGAQIYKKRVGDDAAGAEAQAGLEAMSMLKKIEEAIDAASSPPLPEDPLVVLAEKQSTAATK